MNSPPEPDAEGRNQDRSAAHYVVEGRRASRLRVTLALAARAAGFPVAMVNILDRETQHTISAVGVEAVSPVARAGTLCDITASTGVPLVLPDAGADARFAAVPAVASGQVGAYVGVPLTGRESLVVGTLCVTSDRPTSVSAEQVARLVELGRILEDQLDLIRRLRDHQGNRQAAVQVLGAAITAGEIVPWYQPVINLRTGTTIGYEALARWQRAPGLVDPPARFIPLAEDSDLILDLDMAVLRTALQDVARWQRADPKARIAVNLSGRHFDRDGWVASMHQEVLDAGVRPEAVYLELTETEPLSNSKIAHGLIAELRRNGFGLLLDDFGTGWSSLEYLLWIPVNGIKIDRVVSAIIGTPIGDSLVRAVTGLARELGVTTTIEGIETPEQAEAALALGCDFGQGFLWSEPVPAIEVDAWIAGAGEHWTPKPSEYSDSGNSVLPIGST
jgi:EAL domain-containing protein (putative c-di-GMP-specific phosphodiesterase class I)